MVVCDVKFSFHESFTFNKLLVVVVVFQNVV